MLGDYSGSFLFGDACGNLCSEVCCAKESPVRDLQRSVFSMEVINFNREARRYLTGGETHQSGELSDLWDKGGPHIAFMGLIAVGRPNWDSGYTLEPSMAT